MIHDRIELRASPARRLFALVVVWALGGLLLAMGLSDGVSVMGRITAIAMSLVVFYVAERMRRATDGGLRLTPEGLETSAGEMIAPMSQIESVDRGAFAFKPSNGFLLRLNERGSGRWVPGIWWRRGRRIGVGGVTPAAPAKAMAEEIAMRIAQRDQQR